MERIKWKDLSFLKVNYVCSQFKIFLKIKFSWIGVGKLFGLYQYDSARINGAPRGQVIEPEELGKFHVVLLSNNGW